LLLVRAPLRSFGRLLFGRPFGLFFGLLFGPHPGCLLSQDLLAHGALFGVLLFFPEFRFALHDACADAVKRDDMEAPNIDKVRSQALYQKAWDSYLARWPSI
jgi:hypothetical protein